MFKRKPQDVVWQGAFTRLVRIALVWTEGNFADAQDLAQQTLVDIFAASPEPARDVPSLLARAVPMMKGLFLNRRRAAKRREAPGWVMVAAEQLRGKRRTPEDLVSTEERKAILLGRLHDDLKDDLLGTRIVEATLAGYDTPADQAEYLGEDIKDIRNARKRVARAVDTIGAAEGAVSAAPGWTADEGASLAEDEREEAIESGEQIEE
jgi:DNA-directed RNA polymerase specialized sigma24 family protein